MPNRSLWIIPSSDHLINPESLFKSFSAAGGVRREHELKIE